MRQPLFDTKSYQVTSKFILRILLFCLLPMAVAHGARAGELITLEPALMSELNLVLKAGVNLHHSLIEQNDEQIDINLRDVIVELEARESDICRSEAARTQSLGTNSRRGSRAV